jgi:hypothetical protein
VEIAFVKDARSAFPNRGADPSNFYTTDTIKVKCNEALREDFCRYFSTRERNCEGAWWAERYAYSHLFKCLKDLYQGEIVITGEPAMKPYDQVFLYDTYNDMAGPIEVEQVTHIFSQETGFVTVITPDLVVNCNEIASMAMEDALLAYFTSTWVGYNKPAFNSGKVGAVDLGDIPWYGMSDSGVLSVKSDNVDKALTVLRTGVCDVIRGDGDLLPKRPCNSRFPANPAYFPRFFIL